MAIAICLLSLLLTLLFLILAVMSHYKKNGKAKRQFIYSGIALILLIFSFSYYWVTESSAENDASLSTEPDKADALEAQEEQEEPKEDQMDVPNDPDASVVVEESVAKEDKPVSKDEKTEPNTTNTESSEVVVPSLETVALDNEQILQLAKKENKDVGKIEIENGHIEVYVNHENDNLNKHSMIESAGVYNGSLMQQLVKNKNVRSVTLYLQTVQDSGLTERLAWVTWNEKAVVGKGKNNCKGNFTLHPECFYLKSESYEIHPDAYKELGDDFKRVLPISK